MQLGVKIIIEGGRLAIPREVTHYQIMGILMGKLAEEKEIMINHGYHLRKKKKKQKHTLNMFIKMVLVQILI